MANVKQSLMCSVRFSKTTGFKKIKKIKNSEWKYPLPAIIIKLKIDNTLFTFPVWAQINSTGYDARSLFQYLANSFSITLQYGDGY